VTGATTTAFPPIKMFGFELSATGLALASGQTPTYAEYEALGAWLSVAEAALPWWLGAWVNLGEELFGERAAQAAQFADVQVDTVKQYAWVERRVPEAIRDPELSFSHHREVADLPPVEQRRWIKQAKAGDGGGTWSVDKLRREIKTAKTATPEEEPTVWVLVACKGTQDAERLVDRMQRDGRTAKLAQSRT